MRKLNLLDKVLDEIAHSLQTTHGTPTTTERTNPAQGLQERAPLNDAERKLSGRLMRINHAGEVAAQGLYRGQAMTARLADVREKMERAALEENDHLDWCRQRLQALDTHASYLNPVWYWGSFTIGASAGLLGDKWSLGFVKETEDQVEQHLNQHLTRLPPNDLPSTVILQQMKEDEIRHGNAAVQAGGVKLPWPVRKIMMPIMSKIMTATTYRI
ncbi:MAG: demethoxyubiquinone hydroxylase family protein [Proteobacteria bacterium]|nr:MAG: demethoxyubiquinone hydroxylase family protein [Pseudomonadota bacterium]